MIRANQEDKNIIVDILAMAFDDNLNVNYVIAQDHKRTLRIKKLMEYSFYTCNRFGSALLSDNKKGCALIVYPEKKKMGLRYMLSSLHLILNCFGIFNLGKVLSRELAKKNTSPSPDELPVVHRRTACQPECGYRIKQQDIITPVNHC
jgi:hypothetical protein